MKINANYCSAETIKQIVIEANKNGGKIPSDIKAVMSVAVRKQYDRAVKYYKKHPDELLPKEEVKTDEPKAEEAKPEESVK